MMNSVSTVKSPARCIALAGLLLLVQSCTSTVPEQETAPALNPPRLLVPIYFYHGHVVGRQNLSTGLQTTRDGGKHWECLAWKELITNSVTVDESGCWIYLACGNGVMVSRDAGRSWRLTGGWEMTEVQKVCIDARNPVKAWAATAYGVFSTGDVTASGNPWKHAGGKGQFRFCTDILQDAVNPDSLWACTQKGLFVSGDGGQSFRPALAGVAVRRLIQDRSDVRHFLAATDGRGLMESVDGGATWRQIEGPPDVVFSVAQDPRQEKTIYCGSRKGLSVSHTGSRSWNHSGEGLCKNFFVYGIAPDPEEPGRVLVCGNNGLFESRDGGATWRRFGLESALVPDICFARLATVPRNGSTEARGRLDISGPNRTFREHRPASYPGFDRRRREVLDHFNERPAPPKDRWMGFTRALLEVKQGRVDSAFWQAVKAQLEKPQHSMFYTMVLMGFYLHCSSEMPEDVAARIREVLTEITIYRGDTENHWTMHYATLLLAAQTWPETPAGKWYAGRSTQDLYDEARGWLRHWARLAATKGQGEFDSPNYMFMFMTPMFLLYDFAREPEIRQLAGMMLDLLLADYLVESLGGAYCGGHSRIIGKEVELTAENRVSCFHFLYAGGFPCPKKIHGWALFGAYSHYRPPKILSYLANRREKAHVHTELKRVRNVIRFGEVLNPPVHKYDYMTPLYCMGSLQGGILQPIQQHTWDVTWIGSAENSTFFTMHPSVSSRELAMFFPEDIHDLTNTITAQKGTYVSPDKLVSASPYERVFQHENVLMALYQVPAGEKHPHVTLYCPDCLKRSEENGWIFGKDDDFYMAWFACQPGEWTAHDGHERFQCSGWRAGFVVLVRPMSDPRRQTYESFRKTVLRCSMPVLRGKGDRLTLEFTHADGRIFRRTWSDYAGRVGGKPALFPAEWLFRGPFIRSRAGSGVITLSSDSATRVLDFNVFTITETRK